MPKKVDYSDRPNCPRCGYSHVYKHGMVRGFQRWRCPRCGKIFGLYTEIKPKNKPEPKKPIPINLKWLFKKPQNLDSILDIPCFLCEYNKPENHKCNPLECKRLTQWILTEAYGKTFKQELSVKVTEQV